MLTKKQEEEINKRIELVVKTFLCNDNFSIKDLSNELKISVSTIQRDLNNIERITLIFGNDSERVLGIIKNKLIISKREGNQKGGLIFSQNNIAKKDELGKFIGSNRRCK